jgi:hypothetical protein
LPSNPPFIFSEEDYRTFPRKFAPFVNLVQQILMENELCLLGFSGDDPNFLQWSGWIRDQLGDSARRIYLVGALNLSPAHREYLEARKVTPVDLSPIVVGVDDQDRHAVASRLFLDFLHDAKPKPPYRWLSRTPSVRSQQIFGMAFGNTPTADLTAVFNNVLASWREERDAFPGWLVCPCGDRTRLRSDFGNIENVLRRLYPQLRSSERATAIYEILWRLHRALLPPSEWLAAESASVVDDLSSPLTKPQRLEIAMNLLRSAREAQSRSQFERWVAFLRANGGSNEDVLAGVAYEESLWARDHLDYSALEKLASGIVGDDPIWMTRRAALFFELGEFERAGGLITDALQEVRERYLRDRKSIWNISRLGWTLFLARGVKFASRGRQEDEDPLVTSSDWPEYFTRNKCLPWDEMTELDLAISSEYRRMAEDAQSESPRFDPGTYSRTIRFSDSRGAALNDIARMADTIGLPIVAGSVDILRSRFARAIESSGRQDELSLLCTLRVLKAPSDKLMESAFGRVQVARTAISTVQKLIDLLWKAIDFGRARFPSLSSYPRPGFEEYWVERVRVLLEVLSRLVIRLDPAQALASFRKAVSLAHAPEWQFFSLFEPLGNLLNRSLLAIPPDRRPELLLDILNLPLPDERGLTGPAQGPLDEWPELLAHPATRIQLGNLDQPSFAARVNTLITRVRTGDPLSRGRAVIRLSYLQAVGALIPEQGISFGEAVWSKRDSDSGLPLHTSLRAFALFDIPGHDRDDLTRAFRSKIVTPALSGSTSPDLIQEIVGASRIRGDGSQRFQLTSDEALQFFDVTLAWQPRAVSIDLDRYNERMMDALGVALAESILPVLDSKQVGQERIRKLLDRIEGRTLDTGLVALPQILRLDASRQSRAIELIHRAIVSGEQNAVSYGLGAIERWRLLSTNGGLEKVPQRLRQAVIGLAVSSRAPWLSSVLYLVGKLVADGDATSSEKDELCVVLDRLRTETAYSTWDTADSSTVNITNIRAECVRLADLLRHAGMTHDIIAWWVDGVKDDPMPEVRFALSGSTN